LQLSWSKQFKGSADLDGVTNRPRDRTMVRVNPVDPLNRFSRLLGSAKLVVDRNPTDDENIVFELDLAHRFRRQSSVGGVDLARFQRTAESAGESARRSSNHVIQRGRMRWERVWWKLIVLRNLGMYTENYGLLFRRQVSQA
jgi:hypothetical protein